MEFKFKKAIAVILSVMVFASIFVGCNTESNSQTISAEITEFNEYGSAILDVTADDFRQHGFELGDTFDVKVSDEYTFENIGYFNGYYEKQGEVVLVAYPGEAFLELATCMISLYSHYPRMNVGDSVSITLKEKQGKADLQETLDMTYSNNREDFDSDEIFANFREIAFGEISKGKLYRSASPCDNQYNRAEYANNLSKDNHINAVLNLADNSHSIEKRYANGEVNTEYYKSLFDNDKVFAEKFSNDYSSATFKENIAEYFIKLSKLDTPYLIHCTEGKDRTGFVCMLVEALMGASYEEMRDDYMLTYKNYYNIDEASSKEKYDIIVKNKFDDIIRKNLINDEIGNIEDYDLQKCAYEYFLDCGLEKEDIEIIRQKLM